MVAHAALLATAGTAARSTPSKGGTSEIGIWLWNHSSHSPADRETKRPDRETKRPDCETKRLANTNPAPQALLAMLALPLLALALGAPPSPHLIFIMADDLGSNDVGWNDATALTPEITQLAQTGVILSAAYTWSWCAPSRGAFLTGRYAPKSGFEGSGGPTANGHGKVAVMPTAYEMLPAMLKRAPTPYTTLMAGSE